MPLLNGQPIERVPPPANTNGRTAGWEIRFTGEKFDDYEKYIDRLTRYRKPIWTCKHTGRTCLTYEQALLEERAEAHLTTGIGFSDMLICAMLTFLTQSTLPISQAIDALYYRFQNDFFVGEHIDVRYPDTEGAMYECSVVSAGPLPQKHELSVFDQSDTGTGGETSPMTTSVNAAIERLGEGAHEIIAYEQRKHRMYTVCLFDVDGSSIEGSDISVHATELSRSRNVFTKVALRQFLDDHMRRDPRPNSPWIVLPEWRERFRIPYMLGGEAQLLRRSKLVRRESDATQGGLPGSVVSGTGRRKNVSVVVDPYAAERNLDVKVARKFPTDDLDYLQFQHVRMEDSILWALRRKRDKLLGTAQDLAQTKPQKNQSITDYFAVTPTKRAPEPVENTMLEKKLQSGEDKELEHRWPVPLCKWQIPAVLVSRALSVYMFVSCFSTPLKLQPYPLDYFESALVYSPPAPDSGSDAVEAPVVSSVFRESVLALLNSIIADRKQNSTPINVASRIEIMQNIQDVNVSDSDDAPTKIDIMDDDQAAPNANDNAMDVDEAESKETLSHKQAKSDLPPAGPLSEDRSSKRRTSGRLSDKANATPANGSLATSRRTRRQNGSLLSSSLGIASSDSESGNESAESSATIGSARKTRGKRKVAKRAVATKNQRRSRGGRSSTASSRVATPATTDTEEVARETKAVTQPTANVEAMHGHGLLRHLSRTWTMSVEGTSGEWVQKLVGWIIEAHYDYAELTPIYDALWANTKLTTSKLDSVLWAATTVEQRLTVLELLVGECTNNESIREYLDQCAETTAELKRERLELRRELKHATEALAELDKEEAQGEAAAVVSREQGRREKEVETRRQKERRRLGESERQSLRRLDYIERELRRNNIGRLAPLGSDRFFNRYYFIDGIGGCPMTGGTGRIFVQPATAAERAEVLQTQPPFVASVWALQMPELWTSGLTVTDSDASLVELAFPDEKAREPDHELQQLSMNGELWGYYATSAQIDALKRWLDPKGRREAALLAELELQSAAWSGSIRRRCQLLEQSFEARARAREHLCDRISARLDSPSVADDQEDLELVQMHRELARLDNTVVAASLLPPSMADDQDVEASAVQTPTSLINGLDVGASGHASNGVVNGSSRASSAEPSSSVDLTTKRQSIVRAPRGRRPKNRTRRFKTYIDTFLEYTNTPL
ncbi:hypothetical protein IW148_003974 [Coemansia sp. RSA 1199]|nr:hypothetical protein IW148_003974 [Coemansia sp. RSA 1199]